MLTDSLPKHSKDLLPVPVIFLLIMLRKLEV